MGFDSVVETIAWERVHLTIVVRLDADPDDPIDLERVGYRLQSVRFGYPVRTTYLGEGRHELVLTITDFHQRRPSPDGTWRLIAEYEGRDLCAARFPLERVDIRPEDEPPRPCDRFDRSEDTREERPVLGLEIEHRNPVHQAPTLTQAPPSSE